MCATQVLPMRVGPLRSDIKGTELPPANILTPLERQLIALKSAAVLTRYRRVTDGRTDRQT